MYISSETGESALTSSSSKLSAFSTWNVTLSVSTEPVLLVSVTRPYTLYASCFSVNRVSYALPSLPSLTSRLGVFVPFHSVFQLAITQRGASIALSII